LPVRRRNQIEPRVIDRKEIDRSFTDLGYIGFGDGIEIDKLDSTGNWQFIN
jgi:serine/threonine-protein kinase SRPK3